MANMINDGMLFLLSLLIALFLHELRKRKKSPQSEPTPPRPLVTFEGVVRDRRDGKIIKYVQTYPDMEYKFVTARFEGALHDSDRYRRMNGGLALADHKLIFWDGGLVTDIQIPVSSIRAIKVTTFFTVYCQTRRWEVYRFDCPRAAEIAQILTERYKIPQVDFPDAGPTTALHLTQDIYGIWHVEQNVQLFLLWDRLLAYWKDFVDLASIQRLALVEESSDIALLRLELQDRQVVGLRMSYHEARNWANLLTDQLGIPMDEEIGRKKKDEAD